MFKIKNSFNLFFSFLVLVLSLDCAANYYYPTKKTVAPTMSINNYSNQGLTIGSGGTLGVASIGTTTSFVLHGNVSFDMGAIDGNYTVFDGTGFYSAFTPQQVAGYSVSVELSSSNPDVNAYTYDLWIYSDSTLMYYIRSSASVSSSVYLFMPIYPIKNMKIIMSPVHAGGGVLRFTALVSKMVP